FVLAMYGAGALGLFRPWVAVALPLGMIAAGARPMRSFYRAAAAARADRAAPELRDDAPWPRLLVRLVTVYGVVCIAFVYLQTFTPAAINFDAQWCHITIGA